MKLNELRKALPRLLDSGVSIEIVSGPGQGKSEMVKDTVTELGKTGEPWGLATLFLATQTPTDLVGLQFKGEMIYDGERVAVSDPTLPMWMVTVDKKPLYAYKRGVLFLDEFGQGEADVKRTSAELLLNGQLGPWKLPPGWSVVAASNRASDRSGVTKSFDFVINRRLEIHVDPDVEAWEHWAVKKGISPLIISFAVQNPQVVFESSVPDKQGPWCTPRSLVMLARVLKQFEDAHGNFPTDSVANELMRGMIGEGASAQLMAHVRLGHEMPKYDEIVRDPKNTRIPKEIDAKMLVCYTLASRVSEKDVDPVIEYIERLPKEFSVTFAKTACNRDFSLVNTDAFSKWALRNSSLMQAIADTK
jgi:hypothetical protein